MMTVSLGPLEQEIMKCIWQRKKCTTRDVTNCLNQKRKIAYNTIQTIMTRLTNKGLLIRNLQAKTYIYRPKQKKKNILQSAISKSMSSFMYQFGEDALLAFIDGLDNLSLETRQKLIKKLQKK